MLYIVQFIPLLIYLLAAIKVIGAMETESGYETNFPTLNDSNEVKTRTTSTKLSV